MSRKELERKLKAKQGVIDNLISILAEYRKEKNKLELEVLRLQALGNWGNATMFNENRSNSYAREVVTKNDAEQIEKLEKELETLKNKYNEQLENKKSRSCNERRDR